MGINVTFAAEEVARITGRDPNIMKQIVRIAKIEGFLTTGSGRGRSASDASPSDVVRAFVLASMTDYKKKESVAQAETLLGLTCGAPSEFKSIGIEEGDTLELALIKLLRWLVDATDELTTDGGFYDLSVELNLTSGTASFWSTGELEFGEKPEDAKRTMQTVAITPLHALRRLSWLVARD
ncbi:MAG: hypothetical protein AAGA71_17305 [Pseudomonadota bacterium]